MPEIPLADNPFFPVSPASTIIKGVAKPFTIDGHNLLIANVEGEFFAIEDRCSHEDSRLSLGCLKGELIVEAGETGINFGISRVLK